MRTVLEVLSSVGLITTTSTSDSECVSEYIFLPLAMKEKIRE